MLEVIPDFSLPPVRSQDEIDKMVQAEDVRGLASAYRSVLMRLQLAELAMYRAKLLADDQVLEAAKAERQRGITPAGIANLSMRFARDYIEPLLDLIREPLGFMPGDEADGWYLAAEDIRAKLIGNERAKKRLEEEQRGRL